LSPLHCSHALVRQRRLRRAARWQHSGSGREAVRSRHLSFETNRPDGARRPARCYPHENL
jgi:hypothetical protein